jgi:hypothetical protein
MVEPSTSKSTYLYRRIEHFQLRIGATLFGYHSHKTDILSKKGPIFGVRRALNPEPFVTNRKVKRKSSPFLFLFGGFGEKDLF